MPVRAKRVYSLPSVDLDKELKKAYPKRWGWGGLIPWIATPIVFLVLNLWRGSLEPTVAVLYALGTLIYVGVILAIARPWGRR